MDATTAKGYWFLPTKNHVHDRLPTFLKWAIKAKTSTPGLILVERGDYEANQAAYGALETPPGWLVIAAEGTCTGEVTEWAYQKFGRHMDWIGWLGDDSRPITEGWDVKSIASLNGMNFVSTDDGVFAPARANGVMVFSGDLVRAVGWFYPPGLRHFFWDDSWEHIGKATGCWTIDMSILMQHDHDLVTGRMDSLTSVKNSFWSNDIPAWQRLQTDGTLNAAADRVMALMASKGAVVAMHDARGRKIMLAVPSADRRYEGVFMRSYVATRDAVRHFGGDLILAEMPYNAEVDAARDKLVGHFRRSDCTDLWLVDDDMGWKPQDLLRLLTYRQDFVAVAGPRKVSPPSFAVTSQDDAGNPLPIRIDNTTGLLEVTGVGMAFALLSRDCVERMSQHYAERVYVTADGQEQVGLFTAIIENRRRTGEDFAFCRRWRDMGGKIFVDPAVSLDHLGTFAWSGSWLDHLQTIERNRAAAA